MPQRLRTTTAKLRTTIERPDGLTLLRNSERATYRDCRLRWQWNYNERLVPPRDKGALVMGTLCHAALEVRYPPGRKRGPHPAKTFEQLYKSGEYDFSAWDEEDNKVDALELGIAMMNGYVKEYGNDDHIEIIQPEQTLQIDVYDRQGNYICTWVGTVDGVYVDLARSTRSRRVLGALEHKTAKSIDEFVRLNSGYGEQALSYFWALNIWAQHVGLLKKGERLNHVMFNWLRKALPDNRPTNAAGRALNNPKREDLRDALTIKGVQWTNGMKLEDLSGLCVAHGIDPMKQGQPSKRQPTPLFHRFKMDVSPKNLAEINNRIRAEAWEMAQVREGNLPMYKNPSKDCSWKCPFIDACELHEMGHDYEDMLRMEFTEWNPYEAHELELEKH